MTRLAKQAVGNYAKPAPGPIRVDREPKYYLLHSNLAHVPMTPLQAARINAQVRLKSGAIREMLSPRQRELLRVIEEHADAKWPIAVERDIRAAWDAADAFRRKLDD